MCRRSCILILLTLQIYTAFTQNQADTITIIKQYSINQETKLPVETSFDTSYFRIMEYNPIYYNSFTNTFLGNTGQAYLNNIFFQRIENDPFLFANSYKAYLYNPYKTNHYNTRKPFTELRYLTSGTREDSEQILYALHTQNINEYANIGFIYDLIASKGIYPDQSVGNNRVNVFGSYDKNNYSIYASANFNTLKYQENGGIQNLDEFLEEGGEGINNRVFLQDADSRLKYYSWFFTQKIELDLNNQDTLSSQIQAPDSLDLLNNIRDSLIINGQNKNTIALQHTANLNRYVRLYSDNISDTDTLGFYQNDYYLINSVQDSSFYQNLLNRVDLSIKFGNGTQELRAYGKHELKIFSYIRPAETSYEFNGSQVDTVVKEFERKVFNDISVGGVFHGNLENWEYKAKGFFYLTGYRQTDLKLSGEFTRYFSGKTRKLTLTGSLSSLKPDFFFMNYGSKHFVWNNDFRNIDNIEARLDYRGARSFDLTLAVNYFTGYTFFNDQALPEQKSDEMFVSSALFRKQFNWGPFHHIHKILIQNS